MNYEEAAQLVAQHEDEVKHDLFKLTSEFLTKAQAFHTEFTNLTQPLQQSPSALAVTTNQFQQQVNSILQQIEHISTYLG